MKLHSIFILAVWSCAEWGRVDGSNHPTSGPFSGSHSHSAPPPQQFNPPQGQAAPPRKNQLAMPAASSASVDASPEFDFTSDETMHTEHTKECCPCKSGNGDQYGYKSKYGGGHGYGGYKKQYDGHSYGGQYGGGHQGYGGYQPQYGSGYGYEPPMYGGYEQSSYGGYEAPTYGGYQAPMYGGYEQSSSGGYEAPSYGGYQAPMYGGYEQSSYGGYEAPSYGGYQSMGYGASPYGGSGYGSYSLGYGGIATSALYGAYAKNDETEATDIPSTLTELKTDYMEEYLKKLEQYTKAQDTYKTDTLNVKVNWDLQDNKHEYLRSEYGINPQVHHPYGHMGYGGQNYGAYGGYQGNTGYGYEKSSYGGYEAPTYGGYQPSYRSDTTSSTTSQEES